MMLTFQTLLLSLLLSHPPQAFQAEAYVKAYFDMDQEAFGALLHEDVTWSDPTWSEIDPNNKPVSGKQAVLNHLKAATMGISDMQYDIDNQFRSGDQHVFEGTLSYSWTNQQGKKFNFSIREITILEVKDGLVIKHTDYADFSTWLKQYQNQ